MNIVKLRPAALFIALALGAGACSSPAVKNAGPAKQPAYYVEAGQFAAMPFDPPPVDGSPAQKADAAIVLDWQKKRTAADCARAESVFFVNYEIFWADKVLLGDTTPFRADAAEEAKEFFKRVDSDAGAAIDALKERFLRPRPYEAAAEARPCVKKSRSPSYPSGHAFFARVFAGVLGDIIPERRGEFIKKADEIAQDRVIGGAHYPSDIKAGKIFGVEFHARLRKSPAYLRDVEKLRAARK